MVAENFWEDLTFTKSTPGDYGTTGRDDEKPKRGLGAELFAERFVVYRGLRSTDNKGMRPKYTERTPSSETMNGFEIIVVSNSEFWMCSGKDE